MSGKHMVRKDGKSLDYVDIDKFFQNHPNLAISFWVKVHELQADDDLSEKELNKIVTKMIYEAIRLVRGLRVIEISDYKTSTKEARK